MEKFLSDQVQYSFLCVYRSESCIDEMTLLQIYIQ